MTTMTVSDPIAPPSAPLMTHMPADEPDDIADPVVPPEVLEPEQEPEPPVPTTAQWRDHEALLQGFCQRIQQWMLEYHKQMMQCMEATLEPVRQCLTQAAAGNEHASYSLADALVKMQEHGIRVQTMPYVATVHATTPQGYVLDLQIQKDGPQALTEAVMGLTIWLEQSGFTAVTAHTTGR